MNQDASRRDLLLASVMAATLPLGLSLGSSVALASPINPAETIIKLPADRAWKPNPNNPPRSSESCALAGAPTEPGLYYTLVAGLYERAAHLYQRPLLHGHVGNVVVQQRQRFRSRFVRARAPGSFVRRVAGTPHYDGVIRSHNEPAIIAICGIGPVNYKLVDPSKPGWRAV